MTNAAKIGQTFTAFRGFFSHFHIAKKSSRSSRAFDSVVANLHNAVFYRAYYEGELRFALPA